MNRRHLLQCAAAFPVFSLLCGPNSARGCAGAVISRVRPGDPRWPTAPEWERLRQNVAGNLVTLQSPLDVCRAAPDGTVCRDLFHELKNPYFIGDDPALTQTCGWVGAWTMQPSVYAVAARGTTDVVAAVNFARKRNRARPNVRCTSSTRRRSRRLRAGGGRQRRTGPELSSRPRQNLPAVTTCATVHSDLQAVARHRPNEESVEKEPSSCEES